MWSQRIFRALVLNKSLTSLHITYEICGVLVQRVHRMYVNGCAKARKNGKPLIDIRYHYFLKALDGCYLALDYENSLSLIRKDHFPLSYEKTAKMFEIAVCEDCGEIAILGKVSNGKLVRASNLDERSFYQVNISHLSQLQKM